MAAAVAQVRVEMSVINNRKKRSSVQTTNRLSHLIPKTWEGSIQKRRVQKIHGSRASVDARVVSPKRKRYWCKSRASTRPTTIACEWNSEASRQPCTKSFTERQETASARKPNGLRSVASKGSEVRAEEHVRHKVSVCSASQQRQREGPNEKRGAR